MREGHTAEAMVVAGLLLAAVALAAVYISFSLTRKSAGQPASSSQNPQPNGGKGSGRGSRDQLELQARELEKAGDLDGALQSLKESHDRGSSRAVALAHDLYQRHPGGAFQTKGCPMGTSRFEQPDLVNTTATSATTASAAPDDTDVPAPATATEVDLASSASTTAAAVAAVLPDEEHRASNLGGDPSKSTKQLQGSLSRAAQKAGTTPNDRDGEDAGTAATGRESEAQAMARKETAASVSRREAGAGARESSRTTSPWERGWQGPEGFKPPSYAATESTTVNDNAAGTAVSQAKSSPSSSRRMDAGAQGSGGDEDQGGGEVLAAAAAAARNFTVSQLNTFDGGFPVPRRRGGEIRVGKPRPVYIALRGEVYDASAGRELYGPGGEYSEFAGHDISRRVAKGLSKVRGDRANLGGDATLLDDLSLEGLDRFEQMTLRGWEDTFRARGYPRLGRVVAPPPPRMFSRAELRAFDGRSAARDLAATAAAATHRSETGDGGDRGQAELGGGEEGVSRGGGGESGNSGRRRGGDGDGVRKGEEEEEEEEGGGGASLPPTSEALPVPAPMPSNYAARPIYMGVRDKVFDVSFGGSEFYLEGGAYECLAGRDASRVLAKMSMKKEDIEGVLDYSCLTDREETNLADWVEKLGEGGKGYPVVGWLDLGL